MQEETNRAFTCDKVAKAADISVAMIRKLIRNGKIRAVKIGRCVRIPESELQRILDVGTSATRDRGR
jgi:excisionase family DNA binding protein